MGIGIHLKQTSPKASARPLCKPKKIGGYPTENFFGKFSTLENIVPWEEGKKSSDKKNHTTENSQKI